MPKTSIDSLKSELTRLRASGLKWREIGEKYQGVPLGTLSRIANDSYEPHKPAIRAALGLPARVEVACCPRCGKPPLARHHRCAGEEPKPRHPRRNWRGLALVLAGVMINRIVDMTRKASYNEIV